MPGAVPRRWPPLRMRTPACGTPPAATSAASAVDAILAEYAALRSEIEWLVKDAGQYQTYALGLVAVLPPVFALLLGTKQAWLAIPAIIIANSAFCMFGYLFFRSHQEVYIVAAYLKNVVRPQIRQAIGSNSVWDWEEYKSKANLDIQHSSRLGLLGNPRLVWLLRLLVFLLPAAVGLVAVAVILFRTGLLSNYSPLGLVAIAIGTLINAAMIVILIVWFWFKGDLAKVLADKE